jgi:hypothetical protein
MHTLSEGSGTADLLWHEARVATREWDRGSTGSATTQAQPTVAAIQHTATTKRSEHGQGQNRHTTHRRTKVAHLLGPVTAEEIKSSKLIWQNASTDACSPFFSIADGGLDVPFAMVHAFFARLSKELLPAHGALPTWLIQKNHALPTPVWADLTSATWVLWAVKTSDSWFLVKCDLPSGMAFCVSLGDDNTCAQARAAWEQLLAEAMPG